MNFLIAQSWIALGAVIMGIGSVVGTILVKEMREK